MAILFRFWFNDSWFMFHDFSWSFHKPYFSRKHIFHKLYRVNRTQDYGFRTCKQVSNYLALSQFQKHLYRQVLPSSISLSSKRFENVPFYRAENKLKRQESTIQTFIYYLIYSGATIAFHEIIQGHLICPIVWKCYFEKLSLCAKQNIWINKLQNFAKSFLMQNDSKIFSFGKNCVLVLIVISSL